MARKATDADEAIAGCWPPRQNPISHDHFHRL